MAPEVKNRYLQIRNLLKICSIILVVVTLISSQFTGNEYSKLYSEDYFLSTSDLVDTAIINEHLILNEIEFDRDRWGEPNEVRLNVSIYFINAEERCVVDTVGEICATDILVTPLVQGNFTSSITIISDQGELVVISDYQTDELLIVNVNEFKELTVDILVDGTKSLDRSHDEFIVELTLIVGNQLTFSNPVWRPYTWIYWSSIIVSVIIILSYVFFQVIYGLILRFRILCLNCGKKNSRRVRYCVHCSFDYQDGWRML